jgi:hypothetical protein
MLTPAVALFGSNLCGSRLASKERGNIAQEYNIEVALVSITLAFCRLPPVEDLFLHLSKIELLLIANWRILVERRIHNNG